MLRGAHRRPQTFPSWAHRPRHGKIMFPGSDISGPSGVARLVGSGSLMSSVLFLTSEMLCRFCMGFCLKQHCSTAHRARGSGGSAPRPHRAVGQTPVYQHSLPCFPEATAFCGLLDLTALSSFPLSGSGGHGCILSASFVAVDPITNHS